MTQLDLVVKLCRAMSAPSVEDATLSGQIEALTSEVLAILHSMVAEGYYILPSDFDENSAVGQPLIIRDVVLPRQIDMFFAETWEDLLLHHNFRFSKPGTYFVLETGYYSEDDSNDPYAKRYSDIITLIQLLKEVADVAQTSGGSLMLVFLFKEKLELIIKYGAADLCDLSELVDLHKEFLTDDPHTEQRKSILKTALSEMLKNIPIDQRFKHLLKVFDELVKRAHDNYQLYVAGFSFEKIREEVQSNRLEYTLKLNKVFSEIQNQLLAVPAALLLIGSQMDDKTALPLKNWALWIGAVVFSWFMNMLVKNQRHSLDAIDDEIGELKNKLRFEHAALADKLMPTYEDLDKRYRQQKRALLMVDFLISLVLLFCTFLFGLYSRFW